MVSDVVVLDDGVDSGAFVNVALLAEGLKRMGHSQIEIDRAMHLIHMHSVEKQVNSYTPDHSV